MKKGFTLIELLAVIVILAIIALIVTPVVSNIVANARISANARSVEGHIRNIELAIISEAFISTSTGDMDSYDTLSSGTDIEGRLSIPNNDVVTCSNYTIKHGTVLSASGCKDSENKWGQKYSYNNTEGAYVFEFNGTVIWPGLDSNGNPTQNVMSSTLSLPMADSEGNSIVTYIGIVYMDPTNVKTVCNASSTITISNTGCKKFYIYKDTGISYKMIMDRDLEPRTEWVNQTDYIKSGGSEENWNANKWNIEGPITLMKNLSLSTANWIGTPDIITADEIANIVGADRDSSIDSTVVSTIKWISTKDYVVSVSNTSNQESWFYFDGGRNSNPAPTTYSSSNGWQKQYANETIKSNYAWLFDYTSSCIFYGCYIADSISNGYWTKTTQAGSNSIYNAWYVRLSGSIYPLAARTPNYGIRPVLEVPKSLLGL